MGYLQCIGEKAQELQAIKPEFIALPAINSLEL
jgi:hypothetical protein